jgi:hypothetical protein
MTLQRLGLEFQLTSGAFEFIPILRQLGPRSMAAHLSGETAHLDGLEGYRVQHSIKTRHRQGRSKRKP